MNRLLRPLPGLGLLAWALMLSACDPPPQASATATPPSDRVAFYSYQVVGTLPHDPAAFTQGLVYLDGQWLESTGLHGESTLRRVELSSGKVLQQVKLADEFFAEGLAVLGNRAFQLTWQNHRGFVYNLQTLQLEREFTYEGEGWGLTTDGQSLVLSDGTAQLRFLDPQTFQVRRTILVQHEGKRVDRLNELEYIKGEIFANVWQTDFVVRIDPASGRVRGIIDFSGLLPAADRKPDADVLNGIAHDPATDRLFITGKRWPKIFEVRLIQK